MSTQIKKNGNWVTVAGGTRMWVGTKAALQAALDAGELVDGTAVMVTDDYDKEGGVPPVDVVEAGNMNPVTSNAVAKALETAAPVDVVEEGNMNPVTSNAVAEAIETIVDVTGYSAPGKASGNETVKRTGNVVLIDFTAVKANNVKVFTGLPKPVNMTQNVLFDGAIGTTAYITVNGEVFVDAPGTALYGQLVYFTND